MNFRVSEHVNGFLWIRPSLSTISKEEAQELACWLLYLSTDGPAQCHDLITQHFVTQLEEQP